MSLHIGILLCNTDRSEFARRHENDGLKAARLMQQHRPDWQYTVRMAIDNDLPVSPDAYDGYVLTGSPASVNRDEPWMPALFDLIRALNTARIPMVGLCFGHQAIAHALGGRVERAGKWGLGVSRTEFTGHPGWMQPTLETLDLYAAHEDQVVALPDGGVNIGRSPFCQHAAFTVGNHVFTTQYHPEFPGQFMDSLVNEKIGPMLESGIVNQANASMNGLESDVAGDAKTFAGWMVRFFENGSASG